ncbi:hypoxia up-regulated protein 1-like [Sycon ciliatum]|uniref:hypoxia up-regulated protein 1-like n=1 Tax=Sycon ciliatum TaxID=27933 RepID=UPI0031F62D4C
MSVKLFAALLACSVSLASYADALAVMSVDFGSEYLKIAIVTPGAPMEIVLNKESRRKTANIISLRDGERQIGDPAMTIAVRFPQYAYRYVLHILGQKFESPAVEVYRARFPHHKLLKDEVRGTACLQYSDMETYCVEELIAMMLNNSRETAQKGAEQPVKDIVITVPAFFGQAERRAMLYSAKLAGLNVLQLINSNVGVALNYGLFHRDTINETERTLMFFDMGAANTFATIVSYKTVREPMHGIMEMIPYLTVRGVGFDRNLGGLEMDMRLRDHLADKFDAQKKVAESVRSSPRAMAKLLKEANRVKQVLSANTEHSAQIEGLLPDIDFRTKVTRGDFERLCADVFDRVQAPIEQALRAAEMSASQLEQVIIVGGASRVPRVQKLVMDAVKMSELGKSVNSDEAAALGASFAAGAMTKGFRTKKFGVRDLNIHPVDISYDRVLEDGSSKHVQRVLCSRYTVIPQKKIMTFNKFHDDFSFSLDYGDLSHLASSHVLQLGSRNLTTVTVTGLKKLVDTHGVDNFKSVKAHFSLDVSGILFVERVEALFTQPPENATKQAADDSEPVVKQHDLSYKVTRRDISPMPKSSTAASSKRLRRLAALDAERERIGMARNTLETQIIDLQSDMHCTKEGDDCSRLSQKVSDMSDWLYGEGSNADLDTLQQKLKKLKRIANKAKANK